MKHRTTPESTVLPRRATRLLLSAGVTAALLSGCAEGATEQTHTVPVVEVARSKVEEAAARRHLAALNIANTPAYQRALDPSITTSEKVSGSYQAVKAYVDYAIEQNIPLGIELHDYQLGGHASCSLQKVDEESYGIYVYSSDMQGSYDAHIFISPDRLSVMGSINNTSFDLYEQAQFGDQLVHDALFEVSQVQRQLEEGDCGPIEGYFAARMFEKYLPQDQSGNGGGGARVGTM